MKSTAKLTSVNKKKLVLLIGIPLLLVLSLVLLFGKSKTTPAEQFPAEEEQVQEQDQQEARDIEQYPSEPMEDGRATGVVSDPNDIGWKEYKLLNLKVEKGEAEGQVNLSWDFPDTQVKPRTAVIGYWHTDFDRIEKFAMNPQLSEDEKIVWSGFDQLDFTQEGLTGYTAELYLNELPMNPNIVYFYIYVRVRYPTGEQADYIYGANDTGNEPFTVTF